MIEGDQNNANHTNACKEDPEWSLSKGGEGR